MTANFTNSPPGPFTQRELLCLLRCRRTWSGLAVVATVVALVGPFGTFATHSLPERLLYWGLVVTGTYWIGTVASGVVERLLLKSGFGQIAQAILVHLLVALPITGFVILVAFPFGMSASPRDALVLYANCVALAAAITALTLILPDRAPARSLRAPGVAPLMDRLPPDRRGDLVRISAQGHYVEVVTSRGRGFLLIRFADAIAETLPGQGVQVHRSHWVATKAVTGRRRIDGQRHLVLSDGSLIRVSRSGAKAARQADLL
jgi:hypothetical protein